MEITWLGVSCFRLRGKERTVLTDPYAKTGGQNMGRPTADIVTVSHPHPNHENVAAVGGAPKVVDGPGEYEIGGVVITGISTFHDAEGGRKRGKNTAYLIEVEDVVVCHLGDLGHVPSTEQIEAMADVDVLLVPVGGETTINAAQAVEVVNLVEPKIVVPMHYRAEGGAADLEPVERFCREMGVKEWQSQPKLTVTSSTLPEGPHLVVLEQRRA
jgi:L-ascorbate metabolism protein UlaG (beta-lactamase superfamily)